MWPPFLFAMRALAGLAGLQWAGLVWVVAGCGQHRPLAVAVTVVASAIFLPLSTRLNTHPTLRENFATPFMWLQFAALADCLWGRVPRWRCVLLVSVGVLFLVSWQFAPFVLLIQIAVLCLMHLVDALSHAVLVRMATAHALMAVLAATLMLGNPMYTTSLHLLSVLALLVWHRVLPRGGRLRSRVLWLGLAAVSTVLAKLAASRVQPVDTHVFAILWHKLQLQPADFVTKLYLCGPTYAGMSVTDTWRAFSPGLFNFWAATGAVAAVMCGVSRWPPSAFSRKAFFHALQAMCLTVLGVAVRRSGGKGKKKNKKNIRTKEEWKKTDRKKKNERKSESEQKNKTEGTECRRGKA
mgnify:CR=1 FL=1